MWKKLGNSYNIPLYDFKVRYDIKTCEKRFFFNF